MRRKEKKNMIVGTWTQCKNKTYACDAPHGDSEMNIYMKDSQRTEIVLVLCTYASCF